MSYYLVIYVISSIIYVASYVWLNDKKWQNTVFMILLWALLLTLLTESRTFTMSTHVTEHMRHVILEYRKAKDKIDRIHLKDFFSTARITHKRNTNYTISRQIEHGWLSKIKQCNKWTQTSSKESRLDIDGIECWQHGTVSHSLLQVRGVW